MNEVRTLLKISVIMCLLVAIAWLDSCVPLASPTPAEDGLVGKGLLLGEPCSPPCWQGLVPGVSTQEDVDEFLTTSEYVGRYTTGPGRYEGIVLIRWRPRGIGWEAGRWNTFDVQDGILEIMSMYTDTEVRLGQLVDTYGPPDKFEASLSLHPEPVYILVGLFYSELGMIPDLHLTLDDPQLTPETKVIRVWYLEPGPLENTLATLEGKKGQPLEGFELEWLEDWHDWKGYGPVELSY